MPPWCGAGGPPGAGQGGPAVGPGSAKPGGAPSFSSLVRPKYPGARGAFVFPPSCDMIPRGMLRVQCEDFKKGAMVFWMEETCVAMPFETGNQACRDEREVLRKLGAENAARMRKDDPDWWKTPYLNTYVYGDIRLRTEELQPTARMWAGAIEFGWHADEIFMTHATGIRTIPSRSFVGVGASQLNGMRDRLMKEEGVQPRGPQDLQRPEYVRIKTDLAYLQQHSKDYRSIAAAEAKDLDGTTPVYKSLGTLGTIDGIFMDTTVSAFRDDLIAWSKAQVDADADGVHFDDEVGLDPERAFNDDTMRRFATWLAASRPAALARYGIGDPSSFSYRLFLKQRGYTPATLEAAYAGQNDQWRAIPLMVEFRTFWTAENQRALTEIAAAVRAYAAQKGRSDFLITGNVGELAPSGAFAVPLFDLLTFEQGYGGPDRDPLKYRSVVPIAKLAYAKERPATTEIVSGSVADWQRYAALTEPLRSDLVRLMIMESSAAHIGYHYVRYTTQPIPDTNTRDDDRWLSLENRTDLAEVKKAFGFIQKYRDVYRDIARSAAKIAILYDNDEVAREWKEKLRADHQYAGEETARALWAKNVEFDVVNWKQLAARPYSLVFVPPLASPTAAQAAALAAVRSQGGKVFAIWTVPPGVTVDGTSGERTAALGVQADRPLPLPDGVRSLRYVNERGDVIIHLLNYDYGPDGFRVKKDLRLDPAALGAGLVVSYASLEQPDLVPLDPKDPRVPELRTYGMVVAKRP